VILPLKAVFHFLVPALRILPSPASCDAIDEATQTWTGYLSYQFPFVFTF